MSGYLLKTPLFYRVFYICFTIPFIFNEASAQTVVSTTGVTRDADVTDGILINSGDSTLLNAPPDTVTEVGGKIEVTGNSVLTINVVITTVNDNIVVANGSSLIINGDINTLNGNIQNDGTLVIRGNVNAGDNNFNVGGTGNSSLDGGSFQNSGGSVTIDGNLTMENGASISSDNVTNNGTVNLNNGSSIESTSGVTNTTGTINTDGSGNSITGTVSGGTVDSNLGDCSSGCTDGSLPVELVFFKYSKASRGLLFEWQTASEKNNKGFWVQGSDDGTSFENLTFVNGNGTSFIGHKYSYIQKDPDRHSYYRLLQEDFDGTQKAHRLIKYQTEYSIDVPTLVPNPIKDESIRIVSAQKSNQRWRLKITDLQGRVLLNADMNSVVNIENDINDLLRHHLEPQLLIVLFQNEQQQFSSVLIRE